MIGNTHFLIALVVAALAVTWSAPANKTEATAAERSEAKFGSNEPARNTGIVEGLVRYQADPKQPWKFSRYYIDNPKHGLLAEAVVALDGPPLVVTGLPDIPQNRTMDQINFQFVPETMAIRAGDSVRITNSDEALHNVMTLDGGKPFNVNVVKGKEFTHTFDRAGGLNEPIRLGCVFHGGMRGWIYVFNHSWFKVTEREGRFRFENVPAGEYTLGVVHPAGRLRWSRRIEVKPNEKTPVEIMLSADDLIGAKAKDK